MRRMQLGMMVLALSAAAAAPAAAQGGMGGQMDPAAMIQRSSDRLLTGITLTATENDSVKAVNARHVAEAKTMMAGGMTGDMRAKMMETRMRQNNELRAVLNPEHQAVFDKNLADMEKARAARAAGGSNPA